MDLVFTLAMLSIRLHLLGIKNMLKPILAALFLSALILPANAACQPKTIGDNIVVSQIPMSRVKYKGSVWTLTKVIGHRKKDGFIVIYRQKDNECFLTYNDPGNDGYSYSQGVPKAVAIALVKVLINADVSRYGKDKLIKKYNAYPQISPEEAEVLSQMGLLPKGIKVLPWATPQPEERIKS
jgi:hypothetical protein